MEVLRNTATNFKEIWKSYNLTNWCSMAIGAIIFVAGYVFGTISWRKGLSFAFVVLDLLSGTVGFIYFCYKGLQIFGEAYDEVLALICEDHLQRNMIVTDREKHAPKNNYVMSPPVFQVHSSAVESDDGYSKELKSQGYKNYLEINPGNYTAMDFITHANDLDPDGSYFKSQSIGRGRHFSTGALYAPGNNVDTRVVKSTRLERHQLGTLYVSEPSLPHRNPSFVIHSPPTGPKYENSPFSFYVDPSTLEDSKSLEERIETPVEGEKFSFAHSSENFPPANHNVSSSFISPVFTENGGSLHGPQRVIQSSCSESMLSTLQNDFTQYYQVPRKYTLSSPYLNVPDPCRDLKPPQPKTKILPTLPLPSRFSSSFKENIDPSIDTTNIEELLRPQRPPSRRPPPLQSRISLPVTSRYQSPRPANGKFQTPDRRSDSPQTLVTSSQSVSRHKSYPAKFKLQSPPNVVKPSPSRSLLTPPMKGRVNTPVRTYSQSPPAIPRKMRSSR